MSRDTHVLNKRMLIAGLVLLFTGGILVGLVLSNARVLNEFYFSEPVFLALAAFFGEALLFTGSALAAGTLWFGPCRRKMVGIAHVIQVGIYCCFIAWTSLAGLYWSFLFWFLGVVSWVIIVVALSLFAAYLYKRPQLQATMRRYLLTEEGIFTVGAFIILSAVVITQRKIEPMLVGMIGIISIITIQRKRRGKPLRGALEMF